MGTTALQWLGVFIVVALTDIAWALYVSRVQQTNAAGAAMWAMFLMVGSGIVTIGYTSDGWLLVPALAGAGVGTYAIVRWNGRGR